MSSWMCNCGATNEEKCRSFSEHDKMCWTCCGCKPIDVRLSISQTQAAYEAIENDFYSRRHELTEKQINAIHYLLDCINDALPVGTKESE